MHYHVNMIAQNAGKGESQLTVRGLDPTLHEALRREAQRRGLSVNRLVLNLLREALRLQQPSTGSELKYHDLDHLFGAWSDEEADEFERELAVQRKVDESLWS